jgi:transglutaminase/protease-like cytokinesis protein 3
MKNSFFCVVIFVYSYFFYGQDSLSLLKNFDYSLADSTALNFPKKKFNSFTEIAFPLCEKLTTQHEKFRAIFRWITDNIEYNKSASNIADADKIVRKNKAVCQGFSNLLTEMCNSVGIECETIIGYTKTDIKDIGKKLKKTDHAWNAVKLYGRWYLVDVTWATSKFNLVTRKFEKNFDEHYFLCKPDLFILDHYPKIHTWQLLEKKWKARNFSALPLYYADFFHLQINKLSPDKGKIHFRHNKNLVIKFNCESPIKEVYYQLNTDRFAIPAEVKSDSNGNYSFNISQSKKGKFVLSLYMNRVIVAEYLIRVK